MNLGEYASASVILNHILNIDSINVEALNNKGFLYYNLKMYDLAISSYERLLEVQPNCLDAMINLGKALIEK